MKNEKKQMKDTQSEIKQNVQGTNSDRKKIRTQRNNLEQKEKINQNNQTDATRQRNRAQMKEHSKTSERELSEEEIAYLCDGEFKALVIKMLTELIELGQKMKKQMKDT